MTISYNNSSLHLSPNPPPQGSQFQLLDDSNLDQCFNILVAGHDLYVQTSRPLRQLHHYLHSRYRCVKAAGGIVTSPQGNTLIISRNGQWDLPKGLVEPGETLRQAARREVIEETGVVPDLVGNLITKTYHIFNKYGAWHLKQTSWFAMTATQQPTRPQLDEDIAQALWLPTHTCRNLLLTSYASLRQIKL